MSVVACRELAPEIDNPSGNHAQITDAIATAMTAGVDVLVLPELASGGYAFEHVDEVRRVAVRRDSSVFERWAGLLADEAVAVIGVAELDDDENLFNSAAVLSRDGVIGWCRKAHLWDREGQFFTAGSDPAPIVETAHGRIAVMICYDLEFPEWVGSAARRGADLIAAPVNWPMVTRPDGERPPEVLMVQAGARQNGVFIACCDRSGPQRGVEWTQGSTIVDRFGWVLAGPGGDVRAETVLTQARDKARGGANHLFDDRRTDLY